MTKIPLAVLALALSLGACANDPTSEPETAQAESQENEAAENEAEEANEAGEEADAVEPPAAVERAFIADHPTATEVAWSKEDDGFEASFKEAGTAQSIVYQADGTAGAVETEIALADLPAAVTATLARDYAGKSVSEAARIVENGQTTYEAEITVDGKTQDLIFHEDGSLVETGPTESD